MRPGETCRGRNLRVFGCERPVAFITGSAAKRVGRVIAEHLLAQDFLVVLHSHRRPEAETADTETADTETADSEKWALRLAGPVQEEAVVSSWAEEIVEKLGRVDLLVNSAAIWEPKSLEDTHAEDFERAFRVNALGTALTCKYFGQVMVKQERGGAIVNIGDWAISRPYRDFAAYFPSKGAVIAITQSMAVELATRNAGIRVNAVLPGPVMLDSSISDARRQTIINESLLKRDGAAADVADAVYFLATNPFVTGVCLPVDGGRTIYAGPSTDSIAHPDMA